MPSFEGTRRDSLRSGHAQGIADARDHTKQAAAEISARIGKLGVVKDVKNSPRTSTAMDSVIRTLFASVNDCYGRPVGGFSWSGVEKKSGALL